MTRATLLALAARVEAAQGADRQIDAEIVWRTTPGIVGIERGPLDDDGLDYLFAWWPRRPWSASWLTVPAYTASLDAAASLVPALWCARQEWDGGAADPALVSLVKGQRRKVEAKALTPALALTAAALRAMAEEARDD